MIVEANGCRMTIPGFGKYPSWAKPAAAWPMPFPSQFFQALFPISQVKPKPLPHAFTQAWQKRWLSICDSDSATQKCRDFFAGEGVMSLQELATRGCNPNLVMSLLTQYFWNIHVPDQEHRDPNAIAHREDLQAVKRTRILFRNHTWQETSETKLVSHALDQLESIIQSYSDNLDFRVGRHLQNDKQNRFIFAIHHHLLYQKVGPQWQRLLSLLAAVGALKVKSDGWANPDRRIVPRINSFKKEHPKESKLIPLWVRDWPNTSIPDPGSI
jgi:hypothetical protein